MIQHVQEVLSNSKYTRDIQTDRPFRTYSMNIIGSQLLYMQIAERFIRWSKLYKMGQEFLDNQNIIILNEPQMVIPP